MKTALVPLLAICMLAVAAAQVSAPPPNTAKQPAPGPVANIQAPLSEITTSLPQLSQAIENARVDLARLRIERWKTDSNTKRQAQANAESLQRNMTAALPAIMDQVRANPGSIAAAFKLYRNVNALYDVMSSLTESAGAFGPKEEYQALANDAGQLDNLRRSLADRVEAMAGARDAQIAQLEARARAAAAAAATPPKKIVIDDTESAKKPAKKSAKKKTTTASDGQNPPK